MACNSELLTQFLTEIRNTYRLLEQLNLARETLERTSCASREHYFQPDPAAQKIIAEIEALLLHDCASPITNEQVKHYKAKKRFICKRNLDKKKEEQKKLIVDVVYGYVGNWYDNAC